MPTHGPDPRAAGTSTASNTPGTGGGERCVAALSSVLLRLAEALLAGLRGAASGGQQGLLAGRALGAAFGQVFDMVVTLFVNIADSAIPGPPVARLFPSGLFRLVYGVIGAVGGFAVGAALGLLSGFALGMIGAAPAGPVLSDGQRRVGPVPGPGSWDLTARRPWAGHQESFQAAPAHHERGTFEPQRGSRRPPSGDLSGRNVRRGRRWKR